MTPLQTELLTIAAIEHNGDSITPSELREIRRYIITGAARRQRAQQALSAPAWQWKKPVKLR